MTRVVLDIDAMTVAAARLATMAQDLELIGSTLRTAELPPMPAELTERFEGGIRAVAARAHALGRPVADLGSELRARARAAERGTASDGARHVSHAVGGTPAPAEDAVPVPAQGGDGAAGAAPAGGNETVTHHAAHAVHHAVSGDGAHGDGADLRAATHDGAGAAPPPAQPGHDASEQQWACWMAGHAAHDGLPPAAPIAIALANSGLRNLDADGRAVGFFGIPPGRDGAPAGFGLGATAQPDAEWWQANPDAQLAHVLRGLSATAPADVPTSADGLGTWLAGVEPHTDPAAVTSALSAARTLVARCRHGLDAPDAAADPHGADHAALLRIAQTQLGIHETGGANSGAEVDRYLASAGTAPGNPWCASFVTWAMRHAGHPMSGGGWAAVSHWVGSAQQHADGLSLVSAHDARPGDIVAYDWGGGNDFGSDGHIGILASDVGSDGAFSAVEGNAGDAVSRMQRHLGEANIVFIRAAGAHG